jgi:hypothetical protein
VSVGSNLIRYWMILSAIWIALVAILFWQQIASPRLPEQNYVLQAGLVLQSLGEGPVAESLHETHRVFEFPTRLNVYAPVAVDPASLQPWGLAFYRDHVRPRERELAAIRRAGIVSAFAWGAGGPAFLLVLGLGLGGGVGRRSNA